MKLRDYIKENRVIIDGAMGTYYGEKYQKPGQNPELVNISHPERILKIHKEYLAAGAQLIRTNSFSSNLHTLAGDKGLFEQERAELIPLLERNLSAAFHTAQRAVAESAAEGEGGEVWIAGDIGPVPEERWTDDEIIEEYQVIVDALIRAGAKIILFETFPDFERILPAAAYAKKQKPDLFLMVSFALNAFGYTASGISADHVLRTAEESKLLDAVGFNCGIGSTHMYRVLKDLDLGALPVSAAPNSGYPHIMTDRSDYQENVEYYYENMEKIAALGVNFLGGCCGTFPSYTERISSKLTGKVSPRKKLVKEEGQGGSVRKEANLLYRKLKEKKKPILVELDPPHHGNGEALLQASLVLKNAGVDMVTISDSPMGKLRANSLLSGVGIQQAVDIPVMPHVTCRDRNRLGMGASILGAYMNGIRNLLLVTGDPLARADRGNMSAVFDFHSSIHLMEYVRGMNRKHFFNDPIVYGGALNQGKINLEKEIERMRNKCKAGADYFLTQPIYSQEDIEKIAYIKTQVDTKIFCGILPLVSYRNAVFMKNEVFGIHVPEAVVSRYGQDMSRQEGEEEGIAIALELAGKLKDVGDGYYFMAPFNRAAMIREIIKRMRERCLV